MSKLHLYQPAVALERNPVENLLMFVAGFLPTLALFAAIIVYTG